MYHMKQLKSFSNPVRYTHTRSRALGLCRTCVMFGGHIVGFIVMQLTYAISILISGTLCVICSFPFIFAGCITCDNSPDWSQFIYYAPFVVIFQFGWASVQINHLSLIPDLTHDEHERVGLNGSR